MAKRTKKVGSVGRFGARYGVRAKTRVKNVEVTQKTKHLCPNCGHQKVRRLGTSIWQCIKCNIKFAGGAYYPKTEAGQNVEKMLRGDKEMQRSNEEKFEKITSVKKVKDE